MNNGTDHSDDHGEMDGIGENPVDDFLPSPAALTLRGGGQRMTVTLDDECAALIARQARRQNTTSEGVVRAILDDYARRHRD